MKRRAVLVFVLCNFAMALSAPRGLEVQAQEAWRPSKPVEIITYSAAGGSNDQIARVMQLIIQEGKLIPVPVSVINKAGGNQTIAPTYLNMHAGDPHYLLLANPTLIGNHIAGITPINYTDVTPVALLLSEHTVFSVRSDAPSKSVRELFERLRANPNRSASGTVALGGPNHLALAQAAKLSGVDPRKLKTVVFKTNAESMTALAGGHIQLVASSINSARAQVKAGNARSLPSRPSIAPRANSRPRPHPAANRASMRASRVGEACSAQRVSAGRRRPSGKKSWRAWRPPPNGRRISSVTTGAGNSCAARTSRNTSKPITPPTVR